MSTNNKVFQVLVTKGDKALAVAGTKVDVLEDGQLGIFDAKTNLAVVTPVNKFYLAVGVDTDGDGVVDDIVTSAGQEIQSGNVRDISYKNYSAPSPMSFDIVDMTRFKCETEYAIKLEFRNSEIYARQGYVQYAKTYSVKTDCCDELDGSITNARAVSLFLEEFALDPEGLFKAEAITGGANITVVTAPSVAGNLTVKIGETSITVAVTDSETVATTLTKIANAINNDAIDATAEVVDGKVVISNAGFGDEITVTVASTLAEVEVSGKNTVTDLEDVAENVQIGIRITSIPLAIQKYCDINLRYHNYRQVVIIPSLIEGFNCTGKIVNIIDAVPEEGTGYDIKQKEYHAGGWNGKPGVYRASSAIGLALPGFDYLASDSTNYDQVHLVYDQFSTAGWGEYLNNLMTVVAIPTGGSTTLSALQSALEAMLPNI